MKRTELHKKVWDKPVVALAKELGFSDVGLAKVCRKYNIPRPPRGYWSKMASGHSLKQIPLPEGELLRKLK